MIAPERWKKISRLYADALAHPAAQRGSFLQHACADDEALLHEIESLLASDADPEHFMNAPAMAHMVKALAADGTSLVGRRVGSYRIDALLGAGGMGEVYRATDTRLGRTVALKVLPQHLREDPRLRENFEQEARAVAALRHPHICVLHDIGEDEGITFLVMEFLEGETLAERLTRGPLSHEDVFRYAIEIADALVETHRQGIVHGDLKPANIMLTTSGAQLLDFGLATLRPLAGFDSGPTGVDVPTRGSSLAGTLPYMAPERLQRHAIDSRIDVFAFGAILYEMVTGKQAFDAPNPAGLVSAILTQEPAPFPTDGAPWTHALEPLIARCLAKNPDQRWRRTIEIADELRRLSDASTDAESGMPLSPGPGRARTWWLLAIFTLALGAAVPWAALVGLVGSPRPAEVTLALGNMRQLTADDRLEVDPTISPDGKFVAFSAGTATQMRIFVRPIDGGPTTPLTNDRDALQFHPRWSPDGRHILYVTLEGAFVVPALAPAFGGPARQVDSKADTAGSYSAATPSTARRIFSSAIWSPDGRRIAIAYGGALTIVPLDGVGDRQLVGSSPYELHSCDWSPNARWIACVSGNWSYAGPGGYFGNISPSALVLLPASGGPPVEIMPRTAVHRSPVWSLDSTRLYFVSDRQGPSDIYSVEMAEDGAARGEPVRATTGLGAYSFAFSRDWRRLAYASYATRANIWSLPIPSAGPVSLEHARAVTSGNQTIEAMRVSRDGRWLLYDSNLHGNFDIFRMAVGGGTAEQLTTDPANEFAPDLSPDGRFLAYHSWRTKESRDLFVQPLDGGPVQQVTDTPSQEGFPTWSPDGRTLAFLDVFVEGGVARGTFLLHRDQSGLWGSPVALRTGTSRVSWSPDGRFLAYARRGAVEVLSPASGEPRVVYLPAQDGSDPAAASVKVSDDSRTLYFKSHDPQGHASLWSVPVAGGRPVRLVTFDDPTRPSSRTEFAVGRGSFYFTIEDRRSNIWTTDVTAR